MPNKVINVTLQVAWKHMFGTCQELVFVNYLFARYSSFKLTLKLAGYFVTHIEGGGFVEHLPPRILKWLIISTCPLACN